MIARFALALLALLCASGCSVHSRERIARAVEAVAVRIVEDELDLVD